MSPEFRELLRLHLLHQLDRAAPVTMRAGHFRPGLVIAGFTAVTDTEVLAALDYLVGKGFAEIPERALSPENHAWKATAAGCDYAAAHPVL